MDMVNDFVNRQFELNRVIFEGFRERFRLIILDI